MAQPPYNPNYGAPPPPYSTPQGQAPGYPAPPRAAPPGYAAPQGGYYPPLPQQQPPPPTPPQQVHHTTVIHTAQPVYVKTASRPKSGSSSLGGMMTSLAKGAGSLASSAYTTAQREYDIHASSPILKLFATGNVIQFTSRVTGNSLRCHGNGALDAMGLPQDPAAHFVCFNQGNNLVILRNAAYPAFHLRVFSNVVTANGTGDFSCKFRIHETLGGYVTLESLSSHTQHIGVAADGAIKPPNTVDKGNDAQFKVRLVAPAHVPVSQPVAATTYVVHQYKK
ncbi:uncharacterized protein LOC144440321 [Glandiceps talaboti]